MEIVTINIRGLGGSENGGRQKDTIHWICSTENQWFWIASILEKHQVGKET
jgi:hypothetical protein